MSQRDKRWMLIWCTLACVLSIAAQEQRPSVHDWAWAGDFARVKAMIEADPALLAAQDDGRQIPLHLAARGGHPEMVRYLLERGSEVNLQAYNQFTPLHLTSNGEVARLLLEAGADVSLRGAGENALHRAASDRKVQVVRALLERGQKLDLRAAVSLQMVDEVKRLLEEAPQAAREDDGRTLQRAASLGNAEIVTLLLDHGADVNAGFEASNAPGRFTALCSAVFSDRMDIARLLLERGADPNVGGGKNSDSLLHLAVAREDSDLAGMMLEHGAKPDFIPEWPFPRSGTALFVAARLGRVEATQLLLRAGADVHGGDQAVTPLLLAAGGGHVDVAEELLRNGAKLDLWSAAALGREESVMAIIDADNSLLEARDRWIGRTPLQWCVMHGHTELADVLIKRGAAVNARSLATPFSGHEYFGPIEARPAPNDVGETALHLATQRGSLDLVRMLLDHGADVSPHVAGIQDEKGETPLHLAARLGRRDIVALLLDRGASVNATAGYIGTPLIAAAAHPEVLQLLLEHGADPNIKSANGSSVWDWLSDPTEALSIELLLKHGAQMDMFTAARLGRVDVVDRLLSEDTTRVNAKGTDYQQQSLLQIAIASKQAEVTQLLIERGADVNYVGQSRRGALFMAAEKGDVETVRMLLAHGADDPVDHYSGGAIFAAAGANSVELVRLFVERGADIHQRVLGAGTLLHTAAFRDAPDVIAFLLEAGMDVNLDGRGDSGNRPLHSAVYAYKPNAVRILLERGADARLENYRGETALQITERYRPWEGPLATSDPAEIERERAAHQEIVRLLREHVK